MTAVANPNDLLSQPCEPGSPEAASARGLAVVSLAKSYDKRSVLSDVSLSVARGEVVGLLGPNGAGKTTCFYSIMGLVKPDSGRIMLDGADITPLRMYRRAILGLGNQHLETVPGQPALVEILLHGETGTEQADPGHPVGLQAAGGGVGDVQQRDVDGGFNFGGHLVHGVGAYHQKIGATGLECAGLGRQQTGGSGPVTGMLQLLYLGEIDAIE